jgi:hypothetical protein
MALSPCVPRLLAPRWRAVLRARDEVIFFVPLRRNLILSAQPDPLGSGEQSKDA